jgi:redox-sensitive bicupin YhaK (pirin superfamily)
MSPSEPVQSPKLGPSLRVRRSAERGHANHGWLDSHHTFSFAGYYDPRHMGFRTLRVINEDRVAAGQGFPTHPHRDMEIVTVVLEGALEHKDSMGTGSVIRRGDVQRMSAGTGVTHSEYNHAKDSPVHFFQVWVMPEKEGLKPSYEQKTFARDMRRDRLCLVLSRDGRDGSVTVHQDMSLYAADLAEGTELGHELARGRAAWIQVAEGLVLVNGEELRAGDGAALEGGGPITIRGRTESEILLFDLA